MQEKPLVIFDGRCSFCRLWIDYWKQLTGDRVNYASSQEVADQFPQITPEEFAKSVQLIQPGGEALSGARAVFHLMDYAPGWSWGLWLYGHVPGFAAVSELAYRTIAAHRDIFYWITRILFGIPVLPSTYRTAEWLFLRALGAIYLTAFVSFGLQVNGLIGSQGILPLGNYLQAAWKALGVSSYWLIPTVFWFGHSDVFLRAVCWGGAAMSIVLILGFAERAVLVCLFVLYLSLSAAGQDFMSFQWDSLLLEAGFLSIFLGGSHVVVWLFRWLLFRLMFLSGAVKLLSHDRSWRNLSAMSFHYETQPLPTPVAWYAHQLPYSFHRASTVLVLFIELAIPFLVLAPRRIRMIGAWWLLGLQTLISVTGNYTFFNLLAVSLILFLFDDFSLPSLKVGVRTARTWTSVSVVVAVMILVVSTLQLSGTFFDFAPAPASALLRAIAPFEIVNTYGLFAVMTTRRPEIVVQGSNDGVTWLDYEFKFKAGDLRKAPRWVAPYQPRLDWQMWFAALANYQNSPWFVNFAVRLLHGSPPVLALLEKNPFPQAPPKYVRAELFDYRFTDFETRRKTGNWWRRQPRGLYLPAISLEDVREASVSR